MKWTLREIREYPEDIMPFDVKLSIEEELIKKEPSIISVEEVQVQGYLSPINEAIVLHGDIKAKLTLPSSRSLNPVEVVLHLPVKERYVTPEDDVQDDDSDEITLVLEHDYVDLDNAVIDSIVVNIPQRVLAPGEDDAHLPTGKDWEVLTEDQFVERTHEKKANTIDPRFEALKTLLPEDH